MAIIKKSTNNKHWRGCEGKGNPPALLVGMQIDRATMEIPKKKLGIKPSYDPVIPLLAICSEQTKLKKTHITQSSLQQFYLQ